MSVEGGVPAAVVKDHGAAVATDLTGELDGPVRRSTHWRAGPGRDVDAGVDAVGSGHRVGPRTKPRRDRPTNRDGVAARPDPASGDATQRSKSVIVLGRQVRLPPRQQ